MHLRSASRVASAPQTRNRVSSTEAVADPALAASETFTTKTRRHEGAQIAPCGQCPGEEDSNSSLKQSRAPRKRQQSFVPSCLRGELYVQCRHAIQPTRGRRRGPPSL